MRQRFHHEICEMPLCAAQKTPKIQIIIHNRSDFHMHKFGIISLVCFCVSNSVSALDLTFSYRYSFLHILCCIILVWCVQFPCAWATDCCAHLKYCFRFLRNDPKNRRSNNQNIKRFSERICLKTAKSGEIRLQHLRTCLT